MPKILFPSLNQVEKELVNMIQSGYIHATISQQDGMVRFDTSQGNFSSPEMLALLEDGVSAAISLDKQVFLFSYNLKIFSLNVTFL